MKTVVRIMSKTARMFPIYGVFLLFLVSCGEEAVNVDSEESVSESGVAPEQPALALGGPRNLTPEEQGEVVDALLQARAKQQAEGLGGGKVTVNGAWNYTGFSTLSPDPGAAIEARLVAVDVSISGHTPFFDIDDIEIVDGASMVSYGSDPHPTPLAGEGKVLPDSEPLPEAPAEGRWLLVYAFPKNTPSFHLYYWGKQLTQEPVEIAPAGMELPYPPAQELESPE